MNALKTFSSPASSFDSSLYTSLAVLLLGAISLVVPSGYSLGALMLFLGSAALLVKRPALGLNRQDWLIMAVLAVYAIVGFFEAWWDGQGSSGLDKPSRFLLAVPAMLLMLAYPPRLSWMWSGIALGALGAGGWAGWQKLFEGVWRAEGHTYVIQFGNLSMLLGILCLAGLGWAVVQPRRRIWIGFLLAGAIAGILGSLFSGTRGGWVGLPFVLLVLYRGYGRHFSATHKAGLLGGVMLSAVLVFMLPQTGVQPRVLDAFNDVSLYVSGENKMTSLGARFEMWKGTSHLIMEKPIIGWGENGYREGMTALSEQGIIHPGVTGYDHPHNEFFNAFAKRGLLGLVALLALYLIPMKLFARRLSAPCLEHRSLAIAGVLLCVAYIDFGLSQTFLAHNSGVMMFAFWLAVLWASLRRHQTTWRG